jgi:hypothetical protein
MLLQMLPQMLQTLRCCRRLCVADVVTDVVADASRLPMFLSDKKNIKKREFVHKRRVNHHHHTAMPSSSPSPASSAYDALTKLANGTPCQLTLLDTRALYRLSQWMRAYCKKRRGGAMPPQDATPASAYYMVSFFLQLVNANQSNPFAFDAVNRLFDKVLLLLLLSLFMILGRQLPLLCFSWLTP